MSWNMLQLQWTMRRGGARGKSAPSYRPALERLEDRTVPANLAPGFSETAVATGISNATAMEIAPDGKLFVAEQGGTLEVWSGGSRLRANFFQNTPLTVATESERGLLGLAFDPSYASNRFIYVYYTTTNADRHNRVSRFTANAAGNLALAGSEVIIWEGEAHAAGNHNGGAIHFGADGKLYIATGDNANGSNSQSLSSLHGKILRINSNGTIPSSNPFFSQTTGAFRAIWALGLRNPFTFSFRPGTNDLFINDVGQGTWEEINAGAAGANYGWPSTEGDFNQGNFLGFTRPFYAYDHDGDDPNGCAITGGVFYPTAGEFPPGYHGDYFFADFCGGWINRIDSDTKQVISFATDINLPVDLKVDNAGKLYYLARGSGEVFQVSYNLPPTVATAANANPSPVSGTTTSLSVLGADDAGEGFLTYTWQATSKPANVPNPTFSANGANAAKNVTATFLGDGDYTFTVTIRDLGGKTVTSSVTVTVSDTQSTLQLGLQVDFFNYNRPLSSIPSLVGRAPSMSRIDSQVNYTPTNGAWPGLDDRFIDTFVSRHNGFIDIPVTGNYTFYLRSDDGSKLFIDGQLLINNDGVHGMLEQSATRMLTAGLHSIHIKYFENTDAAGLRLFWSGPGIAKQIVPAGAFFYQPPPVMLRSFAASAMAANSTGSTPIRSSNSTVDANDALLPWLLEARVRALRGFLRDVGERLK